MAYLQRPILGLPFRRGIELVATGTVAKKHRKDGEARTRIMARAKEVLRWLDGEDGDSQNPYRVLGLSYSATEQQVAERYRSLCKQVHPDRHGPAGQAYWCARQAEINAAYRALCDAEARAYWISTLEQRKCLLRHLWEVEGVTSD